MRSSLCLGFILFGDKETPCSRKSSSVLRRFFHIGKNIITRLCMQSIPPPPVCWRRTTISVERSKKKKSWNTLLCTNICQSMERLLSHHSASLPPLLLQSLRRVVSIQRKSLLEIARLCLVSRSYKAVELKKETKALQTSRVVMRWIAFLHVVIHTVRGWERSCFFRLRKERSELSFPIDRLSLSLFVLFSLTSRSPCEWILGLLVDYGGVMGVRLPSVKISRSQHFT